MDYPPGSFVLDFTPVVNAFQRLSDSFRCWGFRIQHYKTIDAFEGIPMRVMLRNRALPAGSVPLALPAQVATMARVGPEQPSDARNPLCGLENPSPLGSEPQRVIGEVRDGKWREAPTATDIEEYLQIRFRDFPGFDHA